MCGKAENDGIFISEKTAPFEVLQVFEKLRQIK